MYSCDHDEWQSRLITSSSTLRCERQGKRHNTINYLDRPVYDATTLTAHRKLSELLVQFDNVTTYCQFHNAILDSLTCTNDALSSEASVDTIHNLPLCLFLCLLPFGEIKLNIYL